MKNFILKIPLTFTILIFIIFVYFLLNDKDPSVPPSPFINKPVPKFQANDLLINELVIDQNIFVGKKVLVNFFSSWCSPCKVEHPILLKIYKEHKNIFLLGVNYKDKKNDALNFLEVGNPYNNIAIDKNGKIALNFGVYGLPETFIINEKGIVIFKHVGPITKKLYDKKIKKLLSD